MPRFIASDTALQASGAQTTNGNTVPFKLSEPAEYVNVLVSVTAVSGTTPSMALSMQWSNDGTTWATADPADNFTALTAASNVVKDFTAKGVYCRLVWTITGTTPSFTFSAQASVRGSRAYE